MASLLPNSPQLAQFQAILNGANQGSLVNQLYAGMPATAISGNFAAPINSSTPQTSTPASQTPPAQAATSAVQNTNTPSNASNSTPQENPAYDFYNAGSNAPGVSPYLNSAPVTPPTPTIYAPGSAGNQGPNIQQPNPTGTVPPNTAQILSSTPNPNPTPINPTGAGTTGTGPTTQQGLLEQLQEQMQTYEGQQAALNAQEQALESGFTNTNLGILSQPGEIGYQTGRQAQAQQTEQTGLSQLEETQAQLAGYEQPIISALTTASGEAGVAPTQVSPGNELVNPATSQVIAATPQLGTQGQAYYNPTAPGTSGGSTSTLNPINDLPSIAQQVVNGTLSYQDAQNMGGSVANWNGALNAAITGLSPNFNFTQAEQNATTQGTIGPQSALATQVLNQLQTTLQNVPGWQDTGNQTINSLGALLDNSGLAGGGAQGASQSLTDDVNEAQQAVATALGTAYNTTPTSFTGLVESWFPPNPTLAQVQAGISQFNALMAARATSFGSPGTTRLPSGTTAIGTTTAGSIYNF